MEVGDISQLEIAVAGLGSIALGSIVMILTTIVRSFGEWTGNKARGIVVGTSGAASLLATVSHAIATEADVDLAASQSLLGYVVYFVMVWILATAWAMGQYALMESGIHRADDLKFQKAIEEERRHLTITAGSETPMRFTIGERPTEPEVVRDVAGNPLYTPDHIM